MTYGHVLDRIIVEPLPNGRDWRLTTPFVFYLSGPAHERVVVDFDFVTNFASIPRVLWSLLPPTGPYTAATVIHDWLCRYPVVYSDRGPRTITQAEGDRIFLNVMQILGVSWLVRHTLYRGVRVWHRLS